MSPASTSHKPHNRREHHKLQLGERARPRVNWSRYEQFSVIMVLLLSGMIFAVTAGLHFFNYGLETQSSSTSGSHSDFHSGSQEKSQ
jgi:hypothetical protein